MAADPQRRAKRIALVVMGALVLTAGPYGWAIYQKYQAFSGYVKETLEDRKVPLPWEAEALSPESCVRVGVRWAADCPGEDVFCEGGVRRVVRACMASRDRAPWCASHADEWASTTFGYHACEAMIEAAPGDEAAEAADDYCPLGYRVLADACKGAALARR